MFKLQRLEITGFKSFADYTEVVFTGEGITAVVGPNGCGKSNVSEAIAWVLGEQRAKSLRGAEMKDVIFQGTSKRKPSGMAEVVLHLVRDESLIEEDDLTDIEEAIGEIDDHTLTVDEIENPPETTALAETIGSDDSAQIQGLAVATAKIKTKRHWRRSNVALDFAPGEAVSVTRRLYLSGESDYLLNGRTCRLRDIQDLFSGTGLSGAHYALIEQGRIGQILSARPSDRRTLIEEAAGISKFRTRQRAAEARLESAKTNLRRISDIVEEIDKQANSLRRQAAKTRRYKIMREEFRNLLRQVFAAEGRYWTELVGELENELSQASNLERSLLGEVTTKDESFRTATQKARDAEEHLSALRSSHAANALNRDRAARDLIYKKEQSANLQSRSDVLKGETDSLDQRHKLIKTEAERLREEEKNYRTAAEKEELALREAERTYQSKINEVRQIEVEQEKHRSELMTHTTAVERLAEIKRQLENNFERLNERAGGLQREGERATETFEEYGEKRAEAEKLAAESRRRLSELQEQRKALNASISELRQNSQARDRELSKIRDEFSRVKNRFETLRELDVKRAVYAPNVQKIFTEQTKIGVKFLGTLADKLTVEPRVEKAVETLFGAYLQMILVETGDDARKVAEYIRTNNIGRIGVLAIGSDNSKAQNKKPSVEKNTVAGLIGADISFAEILEEILPREMSAQVIENLGSAKVEGNDSYLTMDGDFIVGGKFFVSGQASSNDKNQSLLSFKRELRELEAASGKLSKDVEAAQREKEKARQELISRESENNALQISITQIERELLSQEIQVKSLTQEIDRAERHKKVVADESEQIKRELSGIVQKQADAKTNAEKAETARKSVAEAIARINETLGTERRKIETENAALSEKRTAAATSAERRRSAQSALRRVETEQSEIEARLSKLAFEIEDNKNKLEELNQSVAEISGKVATVDEEQKLEQSELERALANLKNSREAADAMSAELAALNQRSAEARNARSAIEVRKAEAITRLQSLNENCSQDLGKSLVEIVEEVEVVEEFDLEASRREVEELRQKIEGFGAVNMLALEELSEAEERLLFLTSQRKDIVDGINSAEEALREIKERSRERFREAFNAVNGYFREFFLELFGGGRGEMMLIEAEDILESGIEIVAQPPGKRLQNILLLSGGEKAMTAIALVMAIFQYRPSPFCLLDEVDAPLDEANVGRFVNKISQMSEKTQFIVITHNKRTMEAAKALYGVTMAEAGVSRVVSVRFE